MKTELETDPREAPTKIVFEVAPDRVRNAANMDRSKRDLSSGDAAAFISLFYDEIETALQHAFTSVVKRHFALRQ